MTARGKGVALYLRRGSPLEPMTLMATLADIQATIRVA